MKRFVLRVLLAIALSLPIGILLGSFDWFWTLARSSLGERILSWASIPFQPLNGESADTPVTIVMLAISLLLAIAIVWGGSAALRLVRR